MGTQGLRRGSKLPTPPETSVSPNPNDPWTYFQGLGAAVIVCKLIFGGPPVTQQYADSIGAAGYSSNALAAVAMARDLVAA